MIPLFGIGDNNRNTSLMPVMLLMGGYDDADATSVGVANESSNDTNLTLVLFWFTM